MRVPLEWLKQYVPVEATAPEVGTKVTMGGLEVEGIEPSALGPVLDVYITPNRGDCLSLVGVGREVAALYALPLNVPHPPVSQVGGQVSGLARVTVEDADLCPRYAVRVVRGVKIGPSPAWMQARLESAGQRAVNNIVDVTNYVMLELGQPLHAFDLNKLDGAQIVVRRAGQGETLQTLDGETRQLTPDMLVIADAENAVAIAGVMGGAASEVDDDTTDILLESAHFDPLSVRRTSRVLKLRTEASYRFERVVDPAGVQIAVDRACQLLADMGQTGVVPGIIDVYPHPPGGRHLTLRVNRCATLLGMDITTDIAKDCLRRLGFEATGRVDSDMLNVQIPTFRPDIVQEEDLIEEVGRIYGYENIPESLPVGATTPGGDSPDGRLIDAIKTALVQAGMQEVITHSLTAPAFFDSPDDAARRVPVRNALSSEISGLRRSLLPTLLDVARHNAAYQQTSLALFEVGRVWQMQAAGEAQNEADDETEQQTYTANNGEHAPVEHIAVGGLLVGAFEPGGWYNAGKIAAGDFYTLRGIVEQMAGDLGLRGITFAPLGEQADALPMLHPGRSARIVLNDSLTIGVLGEIHPRVAPTLRFGDRVYMFEISFEALKQAVSFQGPRFQSIARFPAVTRDLAPRVPLSMPYKQVEATLAAVQTGLPTLTGFRLTDVFTNPPVPEGQKSLTLSFTFRAPTRTMTDGEVSEALARLHDALKSECEATFPS